VGIGEKGGEIVQKIGWGEGLEFLLSDHKLGYRLKLLGCDWTVSVKTVFYGSGDVLPHQL
jgi:hypothetical protein